MKKRAIVADYLKRKDKCERQRDKVLKAYLEDSKKRHQSLSEKIERLF